MQSGTSSNLPGKAAASAGNYEAVFEVEVDSWCYAFGRFPGELSQELIYRVIREMSPAFHAAVEHEFTFDLLGVAGKIHRSIQGFLSLKELCFIILTNLPAPYLLDEAEQYTLAQIVDQAENEFGDVLSHLEKKWRRERGIKAAA